ncbi:MAG TPA: hypothetical protein VKT81_05905 [Bryobacteraceae bacterium]|nr:hypothetical protein [Bryobacteraceae bacterium]
MSRDVTVNKTNPIVRVLPSMTDLAFLMPILFLFTRLDGAKTMLGDGDTGWHIRTGQWILAHGQVPHQDIFSFTKPGQPWYAWEWLWDTSFAWLYDRGGLGIVVAASILVLCLTFALLFRLVSRHCGNPFVAITFTFLACAASAIHWLARPHLFTMLFTVLLLMALDSDRTRRTRWLWALPLFFILWTNLHGGFFVGLIILGGFMAGEFAGALFAASSGERRAALRSGVRYAAIALACAAVTLVNPYGYHLHAHIYQFFSEPYHVQNIAEYQSVSFHSPAALYLETLLLFGAFAVAWFVIKRRDFVPLVLIAGWAHLSLFAARNIPLFAIVAAPFIAQAVFGALLGLESASVAQWFRRAAGGLRNVGEEFLQIDRHWRLHGVSVLAALLMALLIVNPNATGKLKPEYDPQRYPAKALSVLRADPNSRIFSDDEWGDYLLYNLYPGHKVFVDGRDDFYGQEFEQKYLDVINVKYDWEQTLDKYHVDTIVLPTTTALAGAIKQSSHWRAIYDDTVAIIFRAVPEQAAESQQVSAGAAGVKVRDPGITKAVHRDPKLVAVRQPKGV